MTLTYIIILAALGLTAWISVISLFVANKKSRDKSLRVKSRSQVPITHDKFVDWVEVGRCPDCGKNGENWHEGPSGGICTNYRCDCGSEFNVGFIPGRAQIQRIGLRVKSTSTMDK